MQQSNQQSLNQIQQFALKHPQQLIKNNSKNTYTLDLTSIKCTDWKKKYAKELFSINKNLITQMKIGEKILYKQIEQLFRMDGKQGDWSGLQVLVLEQDVEKEDKEYKGVDFLNGNKSLSKLRKIVLQGKRLSSNMLNSLKNMSIQSIQQIILNFQQQFQEQSYQTLYQILQHLNEQIDNFKHLVLRTKQARQSFPKNLQPYIEDQKLILQTQISQLQPQLLTVDIHQQSFQIQKQTYSPTKQTSKQHQKDTNIFEIIQKKFSRIQQPISQTSLKQKQTPIEQKSSIDDTYQEKQKQESFQTNNITGYWYEDADGFAVWKQIIK